jgi:hypothetical protein
MREAFTPSRLEPEIPVWIGMPLYALVNQKKAAYECPNLACAGEGVMCKSGYCRNICEFLPTRWYIVSLLCPGGLLTCGAWRCAGCGQMPFFCTTVGCFYYRLEMQSKPGPQPALKLPTPKSRLEILLNETRLDPGGLTSSRPRLLFI